MMRVIALGGASAAPNPGQGCSGYLIENDETRIVLDLGPDILAELRRHCEMESIRGIVITHFHVDHMLDLVALWWGWIHYPVPLPAPIPLWLPPGGVEAVRRLLTPFGRAHDVDRFFGDICTAEEFSSEHPIHIGNAMINFMPTAHYVPCWAVRVVVPDGVVAYTADTGPAADLSPIARNADLLIAEAMLVGPFEESPNRGSSTPAEAASFARRAGVKRLMLTHFWSEQDAEEALRQASAIYAGPIDAARPGLTINW